MRGLEIGTVKIHRQRERRAGDESTAASWHWLEADSLKQRRSPALSGHTAGRGVQSNSVSVLEKKSQHRTTGTFFSNITWRQVSVLQKVKTSGPRENAENFIENISNRVLLRHPEAVVFFFSSIKIHSVLPGYADFFFCI